MAAAMICGGQLILKRASASRPSGEWNDDDYDVLSDGVVVGRIMHAAAAPVGSSWLWTYGFDPLKRKPAHGYCATREAAMTVAMYCPASLRSAQFALEATISTPIGLRSAREDKP
jgi:hypothetical protein